MVQDLLQTKMVNQVVQVEVEVVLVDLLELETHLLLTLLKEIQEDLQADLILVVAVAVVLQLLVLLQAQDLVEL